MKIKSIVFVQPFPSNSRETRSSNTATVKLAPPPPATKITFLLSAGSTIPEDSPPYGPSIITLVWILELLRASALRARVKFPAARAYNKSPGEGCPRVFPTLRACDAGALAMVKGWDSHDRSPCSIRSLKVFNWYVGVNPRIHLPNMLPCSPSVINSVDLDSSHLIVDGSDCSRPDSHFPRTEH
ncbi:hypothetical protein RSOLAG1IB_07524 [Rhizoctonia solani AG-1 IB]|uniref:Uncharacterized protein n=1 Tax=Thanatephorus cucumeris (strain AG1-IB / isolate 7/3/14) TaxID=1108050 RepID=A0A0B7FDI4_THACB|nr:hypothetical protein RSOLAG1IB_07524 [Rhizoctonia solani AG-1 IB]